MFRFNLWARPFLPPSAQGMEGSPFFPSHLGVPPALALGSTANDVNKNGIHVHDKEKEVAVPYSAAFPLFRPGEALPHALYSPIHQQFLRAQLELANAHSREAEAAVHPAHYAHASAFAPTKRQRVDDRRETTPSTSPRSQSSPIGQHHTRREELSSPVSQASRTSSPRDVTEGRTSVSLSEDRVSPHEDGLHCPICRCSLPAGQDMTSHLAKEIHELQRLGHMSRGHASEEKQHPCKSRYETFLRIRGNREGRLAKLRGLRRKRPVEDEHFVSNGLDDSFRREEDEQIDVLSCDDPETRVSHSIAHITENSPDTADKPHDLSRKSSSPSVIELSQDSLCCNGCTVSFTKVTPVTSTKCWHVRCDACWATNNLDRCPQCNISMTAEDLRRIFL